MRHFQSGYTYLWLVLMLPLALAGCTARVQPAAGGPTIVAGDPAIGRVALQTYGCQTCHVIPGVTGANSFVGPPLTAWAERSYIAGRLTNEPAYLVAWIRFPQAIEPGTAMPNMGVTEEDAQHMAAYLYTLHQDQPWSAGMLSFLRFYQ